MKQAHSIDSLLRHGEGEPPARRAPAWLIPVAIFGGFVLLFAVLFGDRLLPGKPVKVALVLATAPTNAEPAAASPAAGSSSTTGAVLFQASGWIEPDPLPVRASSLIDGVVESVSVLEGQAVAKGDLIASLIDADASLDLEAAKNAHQRLQSSRAAHVAGIRSARMKLEAAVAQVASAESLRDEAEDRVTRMKELSKDVVPESELVSARMRLARETAETLAAAAGRDELESEVARLELETQVKDDEIAAAAIAVRQSELALSRTRIHSPMDGRVLRLHAAPGQKKMQADNDPESSTIAILYDPKNLQVRVDVPLADAAGMQLGQRVRIHCSLLPDRTFDGEVTRITGEADLQRNTLQAKVRIHDPVEQLRPEMLCRVEFLTVSSSPAGVGAGNPPGVGPLVMWIPEEALVDGKTWVVDPETHRVSQRAVTATELRQENHRCIREGVRPGEWVVVSPSDLSEGQRVKSQIISIP